MKTGSSDRTTHIAFSDKVRAIQESRGSREQYARIAPRLGYQSPTTEGLADFLAEVDTAFLATSTSDGLPYAQHRGGPRGFIKILDANTLGFADFLGNRQYISSGNLEDNPRAYLILMDYAQRRRIKIWGTARTDRSDPALLEELKPDGYRARVDQAIIFTVSAWDINCPQHIPQKLNADEVADTIANLKIRIAELEAENELLRKSDGKDGPLS